MASKSVGYIDAVASSDGWASDVCAVGEELKKLGFNIRSGPLSVYTLKRQEVFFDAIYKDSAYKDKKSRLITMGDSNSWIRLSAVQNLTKYESEPRYFIDCRMGIGGEVKKFACSRKPTAIEIESVTKFIQYFSYHGCINARLVPVLNFDVESYHIVMVKPSEKENGVNAVIELVYKIHTDKKRPNAGYIVSFEIKDRTEKREGSDVSKKVSNEVAEAFVVMRKFIRENQKSKMYGNPYSEILDGLAKLDELQTLDLSENSGDSE